MRSPLVWASLLSAFAVSLAQPNDWLLVGNPFLALVGYVPLFWAVRRAASNRSAAGLGALFGFMSILLQNYWLAFFQDYAVWTIGGVALGFAGYGALLGPILRTLLRRRWAGRPFLAGALWTLFEYCKANGFLGFPWGLAPYPFHQWPWFFQIIDVTGLSFLTFLIVSWNAWLAEVLEKEGYFERTTGLFFATMLVGLAGVRNLAPRRTPTQPGNGTIGLDPAERRPLEHRRRPWPAADVDETQPGGAADERPPTSSYGVRLPSGSLCNTTGRITSGLRQNRPSSRPSGRTVPGGCSATPTPKTPIRKPGG